MDRMEDIRRAFIIGDMVPVFRCYLLLPLKVHWGQMPGYPNIPVFGISSLYGIYDSSKWRIL